MITAFYVPGQAKQTLIYIESAISTYPEILHRSDFRRFCNEFIQGTLVSFGDLSLPDGFDPNDAVKKFSQNIQLVTTSPYLRGKPLFRDSGGYQIQTNKVSKRKIPSLLKAHVNLIRQHAAVTKSFTLDIVPPETEPTNARDRFNSFQEVLALNRESLDATIKLDPAMRRSVYAVHQFKTPRLHQIFHRLLFQEERAKYFSNWSVGGMASTKESFSTPYVPWVLPLIEIADAMKTFGRSEFAFHLLGNAAFPDDIAKVLFAKAMEDLHGIKVIMTWDTNSIYNGFSFDHNFWYADEPSRSVHSMKLNPFDLYRPDLGVPITPTADKVYELCRELVGAERQSLVGHERYDLYLDEAPTHFFYIAAVLNFFKAHTLATRWCIEEVDDIYGMWKSGRQAEFAEALANLTARLDGGRIPERVSQIAASLELIRQLDPVAAAAAVRRDMRGHEFPCLLR